MSDANPAPDSGQPEPQPEAQSSSVTPDTIEASSTLNEAHPE